MPDSDARRERAPASPAPAGAPAGGSAAPDTAPVRPDERFDESRLEAYLRPRLPDAEGPMSVEQFPGGHSNLTYCVRFGPPGEGREFVVRRPPLGPVAPKAHDMGREYRVLSKLGRAFPPAPHAYLYCDDPEVLGAPFFVMERRRGVVVRRDWPAHWPDDPDARRRASEALLDTLIALHEVDYEAVGLGDLGKPEGFVERQVRGWAGRWERAKTRELPVMDRLAERLLATLPRSPGATLVHNDFKFDNTLYAADDPGRVVGVFDWEMCTIGDPLVDFGTTLGYWPEADDPPVRHGNPASLTTLPGFPSRRELVERYASARGVDCSAIGWYETFALFKTSVVIEQIYLRYVRGQTRDPRFAEFEERVPALAEAAALTGRECGIL